MEKDVTVHIQQGVHGRIATRLARIAQEQGVRLYILRDGEEIDCSSVLDVLSMAFINGTRLKFRVHGKGADKAMTAVERLFSGKEEQ